MSGALIGGVIGAVIGSFVGSPQIGWMIGSALGGLLMPPDPVQGPRLSDLRPQGSEYGREIPIIFGTVAVAGNVIWSSKYKEVETEEGGKGGGGVTGFKYFGNFAVVIAESNDNHLLQLANMLAGPEKRRIWDGVTLEGGGTFTYYDGASDQLPDPLMESYLGVGNVPAHRGYAMVVFDTFPLDKDGNMPPFLTIEVGQVSETPANLGIAALLTKLITTDTKAVFVVNGGFTGGHVVVRNLSDHSFVSHFDADDLFLGTNDDLFYDPDRNRIVKVDGGVRFMDLDTGLVSTVPYPAIPVLAGSRVPIHTPSGATSPGNFGLSGMYHNGQYVCLCYDVGVSTGRFTLTAIDPDTLAAAWTYTGNAADSNGVVGPMYHVSDADAFIFVHGREGNMRKVPLTPNFTTTTWGTCALPIASAAVTSSQQDPNTGFVWSVKNDGNRTNPTLSVFCTDLTTGTTIYSETFALTGFFILPHAFPFIFTPTNVLLVMSKTVWIWNDYVIQWSATDPSGSPRQEYVGASSWIAGYAATSGYYDGSDVWFYRQDASWINRSVDGVDFTRIAIGNAQNGTYPNTGYYLGETGLTINNQDLAEVQAELFDRAGLQASEYDVTALVGIMVDGYALARQTTVRDASAVLCQAYFYDIVETGGKLVCVPRGGSIVATIPDEDLGAYDAGSEPEDDLLLTVRQMENELPRSLTLSYINRNSDYNAAARHAERLVGDGADEQSVDLPLVLTDTKAQGVVETMLHQAWVRRRSYKFSLPLKYIYLDPTDLVSIRGQSMMITRVNYRDGVIRCEGFFDDYNYVPHVVVTETPTTGKVVFVPSASVMELMDVNMARDADDDAGFYVAMVGIDPDNWDGGVLYVSTDGGANYSALTTVTSPATMGQTTTALGDFTGGNIVDESSRVTVELLDGTLSSTDDDGLLLGTNQILIGDEWLFYRDAELVAANTYTLSGFLRGRRGTEYAMGSHAVGDRFVLWNSAVKRITQSTADLNVARLYKAVSAGQTIASVDEEEFTNTGNSLKPYAPVHLGGGRDASNNATLVADPRTRTNGQWRSGVAVASSESPESYAWDIFSDGTHTTVIDTLTSTVPTVAYSAVDQTAAGITPGATIHFGVVQISSLVGRGHMAYGSI